MTGNNIHSPFFHEEQHQSLEKIQNIPITICGAGSLGGPIAETLARMGYSRLTLIDRDRIEARNLSCQPYTSAEVGTWKARALATFLYRAVKAKVVPIVAEIDEERSDGLLTGASLVIDALDNHAGRLAVSQSAMRLGIPCLHIGFSGDGLYGSGLWEPSYHVPTESDNDPCDYPLTRPFAQMVAALACRVVGDYLREGVCHDFELTWNDIHITLH